MWRSVSGLMVAMIIWGWLGVAPAVSADYKCAWPKASQSETPFSLKPSQARADIDCIVDLIEHVHPNATLYTQKSQLRRLAKKVKKSIKSAISSRQAHSAYLKLVTAICDEHTLLFQPEEAAFHGLAPNRKVFPLGVFVAQGKAFVALDEDPGGEIANVKPQMHQLLSIDGISAQTISAHLAEHASVDGCNKNSGIVRPSVRNTLYLSRLLGSKDDYKVIAKPLSGETVTVTLKGDYIASVANVLQIRQGERNPYKRAKAYPHRISSAGWVYRLSKTGNVGYLFVGDFQAITEDKIEEVMRLILADNPAKLIVDLTSNPGGFDHKSMLMNSYLIPRSHRMGDFIHVRQRRLYRKPHFTILKDREDYPKMLPQFRKGRRLGGNRVLRVPRRNFGNPSYRGQLSVLISNETGSAAVASAFTLKSYAKATLIGSTTHGSGKSTCGSAPGYYELPYSKMQLFVPYHCFRRGGKLAKKYRNGIIPDVQFTPEPDQYDRYNEELVRFALDYVEKAGSKTN